MSKEGVPQNDQQVTEDIQEQVLNRINKLENLSEQGKNPFWETTAKQTHHSQEIIDNLAELEGQKFLSLVELWLNGNGQS